MKKIALLLVLLSSFGLAGSLPRFDTVPPVVNYVIPESGGHLTDAMTLQGNASDNFLVKKIEINVNDTHVVNVDIQPGRSVDFSIVGQELGLSAGYNILHLNVYDQAGNRRIVDLIYSR